MTVGESDLVLFAIGTSMKIRRKAGGRWEATNLLPDGSRAHGYGDTPTLAARELYAVYTAATDNGVEAENP